MRSDGSTNDLLKKRRPVLADLTNRHGKREFQTISGGGSIILNDGNGYRKSVHDRVEDLELVGKISLGAENVVERKCKTECLADSNKMGLSSLKAKMLSGSPIPASESQSSEKNEAIGISRISGEIKEVSSLLKGDLHFVRGNKMDGIAKRGDKLSEDGSVSSISMPRGSGQGNEVGNSSSLIIGGESQDGQGTVTDFAQITIGINPLTEASAARVHGDDGEETEVGDLTLNKSSAIQCSGPSGSSCSKVFELERCQGLNGVDGSSTSVGLDLLKQCSCSFCLKAAYIWSDLHYQDTKGRIAALKKSQKETRCLVERSCSHAETNKFVEGSSNKPTKLELNLISQWQSLFLHTENILACESSQLQSSFLTLKELRANCKADLEMINEIPSKK